MRRRQTYVGQGQTLLTEPRHHIAPVIPDYGVKEIRQNFRLEALSACPTLGNLSTLSGKPIPPGQHIRLARCCAFLAALSEAADIVHSITRLKAGCRRFLHLDPAIEAATTISAVPVLRDQPLQPHQAGVAKQVRTDLTLFERR